jgi:sarcosine oxidase subunit delta
MLAIRCPYCGLRDYVEFSYGGDARVSRPDATACTDAAWHAYVYLRDNPNGLHDELWHHGAGCRRWIKVRRNVATHEVLATGTLHESLDEAAGRSDA